MSKKNEENAFRIFEYDSRADIEAIRKKDGQRGGLRELETRSVRFMGSTELGSAYIEITPGEMDGKPVIIVRSGTGRLVIRPNVSNEVTISAERL